MPLGTRSHYLEIHTTQTQRSEGPNAPLRGWIDFPGTTGGHWA